MSGGNLTLQKTTKFAVLASPSEKISERIVTAVPSQNKAKSAPIAGTSVEEKQSVHDLEQFVLDTLVKEEEIADTWSFSVSHSIDHQTLVGVIKSLLVDRCVAEFPLSSTFWVLTDEGRQVLLHGSAEVQVFNAVPTEGIAIAALNSQLGDVAKIGMGVCMKNKWLRKEGDKVMRIVSTVEDETSKILSIVGGVVPPPEEEMKNLKKRKLVDVVTRKSYKVTKGPDFRPKRVKKVADLNKSMLGEKIEVISLHFILFRLTNSFRVVRNYIGRRFPSRLLI
jgi:uncharacterized protein YdcH (DUF465 family)